MAVAFKNTFLCLQAADDHTDSRRRAFSEEPIATARVQHMPHDHHDRLENLQNLFRELSLDRPGEMDVAKSHEDESQNAFLKRCVGDAGKVSSNASLSTMVPDDDDPNIAAAASSALSGKAWCESVDETSFPIGDACWDAWYWSQDWMGVSISGPAAQQCQWSAEWSSDAQQCPKDSRHSVVPKRVNLINAFAKTAKSGLAITTLMIRNIPNRCSQQELMTELHFAGFGGCVDFVYVPLDLGTMANVGYAFVNFTDPVFAAKCIEVFPNHQFHKRKMSKHIVVVAAHMQGLEANLRHYEKSAVSNSRLRQRHPIVLNNAQPVRSCSD